MISTHDLELTQLAGKNGHIRNAHFQESVEDGALHFDYQLRPGPCPDHKCPPHHGPGRVTRSRKTVDRLINTEKKIG